MAFWLVKSDPEEYSFYDLVRDKKTVWTGVRNFQARNNLSLMQKGDIVVMYHSNSDKAVVGECSVSKTAFTDPTATEGQWVAVELKATSTYNNAVTLNTMKSNSILQSMPLVTHTRLSVMPITQEHYNELLRLAQ